MPPPPPWALRFRDRSISTPHVATNANARPQTVQNDGPPGVGVASNRTTPGPISSEEVRIQALKSTCYSFPFASFADSKYLSFY